MLTIFLGGLDISISHMFFPNIDRVVHRSKTGPDWTRLAWTKDQITLGCRTKGWTGLQDRGLDRLEVNQTRTRLAKTGPNQDRTDFGPNLSWIGWARLLYLLGMYFSICN